MLEPEHMLPPFKPRQARGRVGVREQVLSRRASVLRTAHVQHGLNIPLDDVGERRVVSIDRRGWRGCATAELTELTQAVTVQDVIKEMHLRASEASGT